MKKLFVLVMLSMLGMLNAVADEVQTIKVAGLISYGGWSSVKLLPEYCKKHNLNVELTEVDYKVFPQSMIAQGRGDYDVVGVLIAQLLKSVASGNKVHIFSNLGSGGMALVVRKDSTISKMSDLKGKRLIVGRNSATDYLSRMRLTRDGLTYSTEPGKADVTLVYVLSTQAEVAFAQGLGDAVSLSFPDSNKILETNNGKIVETYSDLARPMVIRNDFSPEKEKKLAACMQDVYKVLTNPNRTAAQNAEIERAGVKMPAVGRSEQYHWDLVVENEHLTDWIKILKKDGELPDGFQLPANFNRSLTFKK